MNKEKQEYIEKLVKEYLIKNNGQNHTGHIIIDNLTHFDYWIFDKLYKKGQTIQDIKKAVNKVKKEYGPNAGIATMAIKEIEDKLKKIMEK